MHIPLIIAILALLTWTLLPQLDRYSEFDGTPEGMQSFLARLAHWMNS